MNVTGMDAAELARRMGFGDSTNLSGEQISALQTISRTISKNAGVFYECSRCSKKYSVVNARAGGIYKCPKCEVVMAEMPLESTQEVDANEIELILDESIPAEVQKALANSDNVYGRYILINKLGEGGMGEVYRAYDVELSRFVALKFIKSERAEELKSEAKTLAALEHKNIARIYDIGSAKGRGFIAMQYVQGSVIIGQWSVNDAARVMIVVCEAVDWAHKRGIIHRDIKPDNIMVDNEGNIFIMDFGLATKSPSSEELAGTPGFLAPEIIGSVQADVYSLGATLYFTLMRKPPVEFARDDDMQTILSKIKSGEHAHVTGVAPEIAAIVNRAIEADPKRRYQSADEMAADISRYLTGFPVAAFSTSAKYRVRKVLARNKKIVAIIALSLVFLAVVGYFAWQKMKGEERATAKAAEEEHKQQLAEEAKRKMEDAEKIFEQGRRVLDESKVYWYRKLDADGFKRWRGDIETGIARVREGLKLNDCARGYYLIGRGFRFMGDRMMAEENYAEAIKRESSHVGARLGRGRLRVEAALSEWLSQKGGSKKLSQELLKKALEDFNSVGEWGGEAADEIDVAKVYGKLMKGDFGSVITTAESKLKETGNEEYDLIVGIAFLALGMKQESRLHFDRALEKRINFAEAYFWRGATKGALGDFKGEMEDYTKAIEIDPKFTDAYCTRGFTKENLGDLEGAIEDYTKAIEIDSKFTIAYGSRGSTKEKLGDFKGAIEDYTRTIEIDQEFAKAYVYRGWAKEKLGDFKGAIEDYTKTIEIDPKHTMAYGNRGVAKGALGDFKGEIEDYTKVIEIDPKDVKAYARRGVAKGNLSDFKGAIEDYSKAIEIDPMCAIAYCNRGFARWELGDHAGAVADYKKGLEVAPPGSQYRVEIEKFLKQAEGELDEDY